MSEAANRALVWAAQTMLVGTAVVMVGGVVGTDSLFLQYSRDGEAFVRFLLYTLFTLGAAVALFWNVERLVEAKLDEK